MIQATSAAAQQQQQQQLQPYHALATTVGTSSTLDKSAERQAGRSVGQPVGRTDGPSRLSNKFYVNSAFVALHLGPGGATARPRRGPAPRGTASVRFVRPSGSSLRPRTLLSQYTTDANRGPTG